MKKKWITFAVLSLMAVGVGAGVVSTANPLDDGVEKVNAVNEEVYREADFTYNESRFKVNNYTSTKTLTTLNNNVEFSVSIKGGSTNNNDKNWNFVKWGGRSQTGTSNNQTAYVETVSPLTEKITKIGINFTDFYSSNGDITGIELYTKDSTTQYTLTKTLSIDTSTDFETLPAELFIDLSADDIKPGLNYKLNFLFENTKTGTKGGNGVFAISKISFFKSTAAKVLDHISAEPITNHDFYEGDKLLANHFITTAYYTDGSSEVVNALFDENTILVQGQNTISITFEGKTCNLIINAKPARTPTEITIEGTLPSYIVDGTDWDFSNLTFKVLFNDNSTIDITSKLGSTLKVVVKETGTQNILEKAKVGVTSVDISATLTNDAEFGGITVSTQTALTVANLSIVEQQMTLIWDKPTIMFRVGDPVAVTGTLTIKYNNGSPSRVLDPVQDKISLFLNNELIGENRLFALSDNGKTMKVSYSDGILSAESKGFAIEVTNDIPVSKTISEIGTENNWTNKEYYNSFNLDEHVHVSIPENASNGYYDGSEWRIYQNKNGDIKINLDEGFKYVSFKMTYLYKNTGIIVGYDSGAELTTGLTNNELTFVVGNSKDTVTNGQVKITSFEVVYTPILGYQDIDLWSKSFVADTNEACNKLNVTNNDWNKLAESYNTISSDAKNLFQSTAKLSNTDIAKNDIEKAAQRYDYIVSKYGYIDFANRGIVSNNPVTNVIDNSNMIVTVITIAIASISSIALIYIFARKRKAN